MKRKCPRADDQARNNATIIAQRTGELLRASPLRAADWRRWSSALHHYLKTSAALLDVNRHIADRSHESMPSLFPMKYLAGIERHREIEIARQKFP